MNNIKIETNSNSILKISKGVICSFVISLMSVFIFSIVLTYSSVSENIIPIVIIIITSISILIGAMIGCRKLNKNGMLNGSTIGMIYVFLLYFISSMLNTGFQINIYTIFMIILGVISGVIGGIVGVNS